LYLEAGFSEIPRLTHKREKRNVYEILVGIPEREKIIGANERIILKWILEK
jgi:hypothetical protein